MVPASWRVSSLEGYQQMLVKSVTHPIGLVPVARPAVMGVCFGEKGGLFSFVELCLITPFPPERGGGSLATKLRRGAF